ncbi:hypothetical protein IRY61_02150 [Candidatus Saccharibacteria bacterium]|nr:hypothetical protein [Candidatus Saccharibacteria bacterium]
MLTPTTELEAINTMLTTIGESPVNTVEDSGLLDVVIARQILHTTSREVQARGWHFNTEKNFPLQPTVDGTIVLPDTVLRVDTVGEYSDIDVVVRGNRLYDRRNHTYTFKKPLNVDMVVLLPFEHLPEAARIYITIRASRIFQERVVGSETLSAFSRQDEIRALAALRDMDTETADYNVLKDNYAVARVLHR